MQVPIDSIVTTPDELTEHTRGVVDVYVSGWPEVLDAVIGIVPPELYVAGEGEIVGDVTVIVSVSTVTL